MVWLILISVTIAIVFLMRFLSAMHEELNRDRTAGVRSRETMGAETLDSEYLWISAQDRMLIDFDK